MLDNAPLVFERSRKEEFFWRDLPLMRAIDRQYLKPPIIAWSTKMATKKCVYRAS